MEIKIKDKDTLIDATIEVVDGVMIVSPKEEKYEPKDGDVVAYMNTGVPTIYIYRAGTSRNTSYYAAYSSIYDKTYISNLTDHLQGNQNIRLATEEETKILFDKLKEEGYEFDFEKKELVKLRWKPKIGETYYRPDFLHCEFICYSGITDYNKMVYIKDHINKGWVFRTKEECQSFCDKLNQAINQIKP
jgi:hypothetical protein